MPKADFFGESFELGEVSQFSLLEFSEAIDGQEDENGVPVAAATMRLLREAIAPKDWARFRKTAKLNKATGEHLMPIVEKAVEALEADRPTERPSDSSDGPDDTESKYVSPSVRRAMTLEAGRPDRQMAILRSSA